MIDRVTRRYGFRGTWLIVMGLLWILFGIGILIAPYEPRPWVLFEMVPPIYRAPLWWATGGLALWQGLRGPRSDDSLGHVALYVMPATRLVSFTVAWVVHGCSWVLVQFGQLDHTVGLAQGWYAALIWGVLSVMLALAAAWPNPALTLPRPPASECAK